MKKHLYRGIITSCLIALVACIYGYLMLPQVVWQSLILALLIVWLFVGLLVLVACRP